MTIIEYVNQDWIIVWFPSAESRDEFLSFVPWLEADGLEVQPLKTTTLAAFRYDERYSMSGPDIIQCAGGVPLFTKESFDR